MFLNKLELINVRSFKVLNVCFSKSINLLVGHNNSGKSTVIKSILRLQSAYVLGYEDIRKGHNFSHTLIDLIQIKKEERKLFEMKQGDNGIVFPATDKVKVILGTYNHLQEDKRFHDSYFFDLQLRHDANHTGKFKLYDKNNIEVLPQKFTDFPAQENHENFIYPFLAKRKTSNYTDIRGENEAYAVTEDLRNLTAKVEKLSNSSHPKSAQFNSLVHEILGFQIGSIPYKNSRSSLGVFVNGSVVISIENMGEGVINILGLLVTLLTEDNKLYLIEEPENDIHPKALKQLLELILEKSSNNQFIISTHSNIVVKYLGVAGSKIFHFRWNPFEQTKRDRLPTTTVRELQNNPEERISLLADMGYEFFDFDLYQSYLIFEESSAESLFREYLIPTFFPKIKDRIRTVAASGADDLNARFSDLLRLFVYLNQSSIYHEKAWLFADGDKAGRDSIKKIRGKFNGWPDDHFVNFEESNIEQYYPSNFRKSFEEISSITDKAIRWRKKTELTKSLLDWAKDNPDSAKEHFKVHAKELLDLLSAVKAKLNA